MYSDLSTTAKLGITTLLMVFILGIAMNLNMVTQNMVNSKMEDIQRATLTTNEQTLRELATEGKVISGAMLYSALLQYGDSVQGFVVKPGTFGTNNPAAETTYGPVMGSTTGRSTEDLIDLIGDNITGNYILLVNSNTNGSIGLWLYVMSGD